ncbi:MAG: hypothetical protein IJB69_02785 [Clostridia bacterium]|nr:hypothetical protein [Clostridia bacterium]
MMNPESLIGAPVALQAPDGRVFRFHVAALVPYAGETYAVLEEDGEQGQMLVTAIEMTDDHIPAFVVQGEEDIITSVMEKLVARSIARAMEQEQAQDCDCGHHHHTHDCSCGHQDHHDHDCHCGHHHH